jgi:RNA polymerase sigma factor (sigma-70 family)
MTNIAAEHRPDTVAAQPSSSQSNTDCRYRDLMRVAQDGDKLAYATLLKEVLPLLRRWIQNRLRFLQAADVEDIVQDTLLSLHAARATYDPARPFLPWLLSIAHNRLVDGARRSARRSANEILTDELPTGVAEEPAFAADSYGDPQALRRAVQRLPAAQRTAVELLKLREMSLKEAAHASGMSVGALKISVHRAIKSLRMSIQA